MHEAMRENEDSFYNWRFGIWTLTQSRRISDRDFGAAEQLMLECSGLALEGKVQFAIHDSSIAL